MPSFDVASADAYFRTTDALEEAQDERVVARVDVELAHVVGLGVVAPF